MKERDYLRKRQELEREYNAKLQALDTVWAMFNASAAPSPKAGGAVPARRFERTPAGGGVSKRSAVRKVLNGFAGKRFHSREVRELLTQEYPEISAALGDNQLSSIVSRLAVRGEIRMVSEKVGRSPAVYELIEGARVQ